MTLLKCPLCPKNLMRGWRMPWVGPAGAFRHMTCACGVEAWIKKVPNKPAVVFSFRTNPAQAFKAPFECDDW